MKCAPFDVRRMTIVFYMQGNVNILHNNAPNKYKQMSLISRTVNVDDNDHIVSVNDNFFFCAPMVQLIFHNNLVLFRVIKEILKSAVTLIHSIVTVSLFIELIE